MFGSTVLVVLLQLGVGLAAQAGSFVNEEGGIPVRAFATSPTANIEAIAAALAEEEPDYICSKTKACKIGCCGPL